MDYRSEEVAVAPVMGVGGCARGHTHACCYQLPLFLESLRVVLLLHCRLTNLGSGLGHQILDESKCQVSAVIGRGLGGVPGAQGYDMSNFVPVKLTCETVSCTFPL